MYLSSSCHDLIFSTHNLHWYIGKWMKWNPGFVCSELLSINSTQWISSFASLVECCCFSTDTESEGAAYFPLGSGACVWTLPQPSSFYTMPHPPLSSSFWKIPRQFAPLLIIINFVLLFQIVRSLEGMLSYCVHNLISWTSVNVYYWGVVWDNVCNSIFSQIFT